MYVVFIIYIVCSQPEDRLCFIRAQTRIYVEDVFRFHILLYAADCGPFAALQEKAALRIPLRPFVRLYASLVCRCKT